MNDHRPITAILTAAQLDRVLEQLWAEFADVPMNPETECMDAPFLHFPAGTEREDIWHWFDERYSLGVVNLLYGGDENCDSQMEQSITLKEICPECSTRDCMYNCSGICYALLSAGQAPYAGETCKRQNI